MQISTAVPNLFHMFKETPKRSGTDVEKIKALAKRLNRQYIPYSSPPIFSDVIIAGIGLTLKRKEFSDGHVASLDRMSKTIFITNDTELNGKWGNFAAAYELGHWLLHKKPHYNFHPSVVTASKEPPKGRQEKEREEREASYFASYLLMPDDLVLENPEYLYHDMTKGTKSLEGRGAEIFEGAFLVPREVIDLRKTLDTYPRDFL